MTSVFGISLHFGPDGFELFEQREIYCVDQELAVIISSRYFIFGLG